MSGQIMYTLICLPYTKNYLSNTKSKKDIRYTESSKRHMQYGDTFLDIGYIFRHTKSKSEISDRTYYK